MPKPTAEQFFTDPAFQKDKEFFEACFDKLFADRMERAKKKATESGAPRNEMNFFDWLAGAAEPEDK